jgi:hypothetical protein
VLSDGTENSFSSGCRALKIAIGCPVRLSQNICIKAGLCNGTPGTVVDIWFSQGIMTQLNLLSQASECVAVVIPVTFFWIWM